MSLCGTEPTYFEANVNLMCLLCFVSVLFYSLRIEIRQASTTFFGSLAEEMNQYLDVENNGAACLDVMDVSSRCSF
jgi:hypothetical protein